MKKGKPESGFALLFILAMAAAIAIMLYIQLPRVAFEAQRDKEQLLIDRGEQYSRAVQLYVRKYNKFPADMDALQNTQSIRFLRRKYVDPMTGKDDWRIIHVGPGGVFTDSVTHSTKSTDKNAPQTFILELPGVGGNAAGGNDSGVNLATRRRPSEQGGAPGNDPLNAALNGTNNPGSSGSTSSGPVMVLPDGRIVPANVTGTAPPPGALPGQPGQPGQPGATGFTGLQTPNGIAFQQGNNTPGGGAPNAAANLINQILTTPRPQPGGATVDQFGNQTGATGAGIGGGISSSNQQQGQVIGGGFAGVASKMEREGIKSYGERTAYNEWEFLYDISKDPARAGGGRGGAANPQNGANPSGAPTGSVPGSISPGRGGATARP